VQNIGCGLKLRGVGRAEIAGRVGELLAMLRLEGLGARKVTALSGGQRQRVALGRMFTASLAGNYQIAANTALILLVPSIAFMLLIVRFLNTEMLATVG
jgi:ABC-type taurine transport system ATPase subunit